MAPGRAFLFLAIAASCVTDRPAAPPLAPPQPGMCCDGDHDADGRVIWWLGKLDYTCTSVNGADAGARIDLYRRGEMEWEHLGGDGRVPRLVRPGEEDLSSINLSRQPDAPVLVVATFLDGAGRATDVETALLRPDPDDPYGWLAP
jgi:hypothetical protein